MRPLVHRAGPPPGSTGGFGERTCQACHFDGPLNAPGGELVLRGLPARYEAGGRYELVVVLRRPGMASGGFQLAARFADGEARGTPAGEFLPRDLRSVIVPDSAGRVPYLQHAPAGTTTTGDSIRWAFRWTAPRAPHSGRVVFHVAANAANDDNSPLADWIYTVAREVSPRAAP